MAGDINVSIPHFKAPFSFSANGAAVVEQDTFDEIISSLQTILMCPVGACPDLPTFGIPDMTFQPAPPNTTALVSALQLWEPRASETAVAVALDASQANWSVQVTPQVLGTGQ